MEWQLLCGYMKQAWMVLWIVLVIQLSGVAALLVLAIGISLITKGIQRGHATPTQQIKTEGGNKFRLKLKKIIC